MFVRSCVSAASIMAVMALSGPALPDDPVISVTLDGKPLVPYFEVAKAPLPPVLLRGYLMIPLRFFNENLHQRAWWDRKWGTISLGNEPVHLKVGEREAHRPAAVIGGHATESV